MVGNSSAVNPTDMREIQFRPYGAELEGLIEKVFG